MPESRAITGRQVAAEALTQFDKTGKDAADILAKLITKTTDRGKASDIVFGTIRNRCMIDNLLEKFCSVSPDRVAPKMLNILRCGTYELVYCPSIEQYAIVNEAVAQAPSKKQRGFINAVLRTICRAIENRHVPLDMQNPAILPQDPGHGCEFKKPILSDYTSKPAEYLAAAFSLPIWLIQEWIERFGTEKVIEICFASNRRCGLYLQPNTLKISAPQLLEKLRSSDKNGGHFKLTADGKMIDAASCGQVTALPGFAEGLFTIQDPTAAEVAETLNPRAGETIIDICAAPGGKTVRLAQLMDDTGVIIASDIDAARLKKVGQNCRRLDITCVKTVPADQLESAVKDMRIDALLADVPCSNAGVMAKRCEVRHRITKSAVEALCRTQLSILQRAADLAETGTRICYSTCSITNAENRGVIDSFLAANPDFTLNCEKLTLPAVKTADRDDRDGGYSVMLTKK